MLIGTLRVPLEFNQMHHAKANDEAQLILTGCDNNGTFITKTWQQSKQVEKPSFRIFFFFFQMYLD
jgi:hypothetical protein